MVLVVVGELLEEGEGGRGEKRGREEERGFGEGWKRGEREGREGLKERAG